MYCLIIKDSLLSDSSERSYACWVCIQKQPTFNNLHYKLGIFDSITKLKYMLIVTAGHKLAQLADQTIDFLVQNLKYDIILTLVFCLKN